jgi:hypothetical protein
MAKSENVDERQPHPPADLTQVLTEHVTGWAREPVLDAVEKIGLGNQTIPTELSRRYLLSLVFGSSVGISTGYALDDRGVGVKSPGCQEFSLPHVVQTGTRAHTTSYPMGTGGSFPGGTAAVA